MQVKLTRLVDEFKKKKELVFERLTVRLRAAHSAQKGQDLGFGRLWLLERLQVGAERLLNELLADVLDEALRVGLSLSEQLADGVASHRRLGEFAGHGCGRRGSGLEG